MEDWSELEVSLIVDDYFQMLNLEIKGEKYNKAAHRRRLSPFLNNRNKAVEFKHRNISAVLIKYGLPYINGYKPLNGFQKLLEEKVLAYLSKHPSLDSLFSEFANQEIVSSKKVVFEKWEESPPESSVLNEPEGHIYLPRKQNYIELQQRNSSIGLLGEALVFDYEKWRLNKAGLPSLAKEVKWISKDEGDGAGYDILSKNAFGTDIYIEVKTTTLGKEAPIFFSKRENDFSNANKDAFNLYRVFDVKRQPKMFNLKGRFNDICNVEPVSFKGTF